MLVKLGLAWVNPESVDSIYPDSGKIYIVTKESEICQDCADANASVEQFASIVNAANQSQSFGGEVEK